MQTDDKTRFFYGPQSFSYNNGGGNSIYNIWRYQRCQTEVSFRTGQNCDSPEKQGILSQLVNKAYWPKFEIADKPDDVGVGISDPVSGMIGKIPNNPSLRIDISPDLGSQAKNWPIYSDVSLVNTYNFQSSLIHPMWGYFQGVFYSDDPLYNDSDLPNQLAKYFGIDYLYINKDNDPLEKYSNWKSIYSGRSGVQFYEIVAPETSTGLYSIITQPRILVIGDQSKGAYETVFRVSNLGTVNYDDGFLVEGDFDNLNKYKYEYIKNFDLIILHGYKYKNQRSAMKLLSDYVKNGGSVFIDNGWQYVAPDWGKGPDANGNVYEANLLDPFPVKKSLWQSFGPTWDGYKLNSEVSDLDLNSIDAPNYLDKGWGASIANISDLTDGSFPIISNSEKVILAGRNFGKGKVVWSGMNIFPFAYGKKGEATIDFIGDIINWLLPNKEPLDELSEDNYIKYTRTNPDQAQFVFNKGLENFGFTFREAYYPGWKSYLVSGNNKSNLNISRSGPGFMFVNLENVKAGDILIFKYELPFKVKLSIAISIVTSILIILYLFNIYSPRINLKLKSNLRKTSNDDEDY